MMTNPNAQPQTLIDTADFRFVNLYREIAYGDIREINAKLISDGAEGVGVMLIAMVSDGKSKKFALRASVVDALFDAIGDYKTYLALKKEKEAREAAEKLHKLHKRVADLGGTMTLMHKAEGEHDWDRYTAVFEGRWSHREAVQQSVYRVEELVDSIELTIESNADKF